MLTELRKIIDINTDNCDKEIKVIQMNQSKIDNSVSEIKSNLHRELYSASCNNL